MIKVKNLSKSFDNGNSFAVKNLSFDINEGEIVSLIGTSGCGKTTTLRMINRLVEPSSGSILINSKNAIDMDAVQWRRNIGYVVQKAGLFPHLTILENISLLSSVLNKPLEEIKKRVQKLMSLVNLNFHEYKDRYPVELSGGQQQRVGIVRALMEDPPVLLMDEPFGALDPITRSSIHKELIRINQDLKKTILLVTHDIQEAFKLSDRVIVMDQGEILQIGTPEEIKSKPKSAFIKEFVE